jgi:enoyl-CoA hydratase/carnithine racemase
MPDYVLYEVDGSVAMITLNRPERMNAMDQSMLRQLIAAAERAEADEDIRAVIVTGAGKGFSSGFDLKAQAENPPSGVAEWRPVLRRDFDACMKFWHLSKPTVAAVHGPVMAGACELAMACDLTIASENAVFGEPELRFGAGIVCLLLPWVVGPKRAKEIILLGLDNVDAREALSMGLVNRVVPDGTHLEEALKVAQQLTRIDPSLMSQTKQAINRAYSIMGLEQALDAGLDIDTLIEGEGMPSKRKFLAITREQGLRAALTWRDREA